MLIQHANSVAIVAVEKEELLVVHQRRGGSNSVTVELPSGKLEPDEEIEAAARRELAEECGLAARYWRYLGAFWAVPAYSTEYVHVYAAAGLEPALDRPAMDADEDIEGGRIPIAKAFEELSDAVSIAAFALWERRR